MSQPSLFSYFKKLDGNKPVGASPTNSPKIKNEIKTKTDRVKSEDKENSIVRSPKTKVEPESCMDVDLYENGAEDDVRSRIKPVLFYGLKISCLKGVKF